jgi:hypothetical protein
MFEKIGQAAEKAANSVGMSRRRFLGRLGQTALGVAGVVAGMLALPRSASAGNGTLYQCGCFTRGGGSTIWNECGKCSWNVHFCKAPGRKQAIGAC